MAKPELIDDPSTRENAIAAAARALSGELDEHPSYAMLEQAVDRTADSVTREIVESHVEICPQCRAELSDLSELAGSPPARMTPRWLGAAAAILIAVMAGSYWNSRSQRVVPPSPPPAAVTVTPAPDQWTQLAAAVLAAGKMDPPPILRDLRPTADVLRDPAATSSRPAMTPAGVVIESVTPTLRWTAAGGRSAVSVVVSVFEGRRRVARSDVLDTNEWRVSPPLARGRTYAWQIEVRRPESVDIVPAPPAPPALFHVLDERSAALLADARRRHGNDPLIIGVLHARMGMQTAAVDELRAWAARHPEERNAAALADSVARW